MTQDPIEINRKAYDEIASRFAARRAMMGGQLIDVITRLKGQVRPGERVLDLGCGAGRDLAWLEQAGLRVLGADLSVGMLAEARRVTGCALCQMDMRRLGFARGSFAAVWCNAALLHLPSQQLPGALAEIARLLRPGGHLFALVQKGSGEGLETNAEEHITRFFARYDGVEMGRHLEQAGFSVLERGEYEYGRTWLWHAAARGES